MNAGAAFMAARSLFIFILGIVMAVSLLNYHSASGQELSDLMSLKSTENTFSKSGMKIQIYFKMKADDHLGAVNCTEYCDWMKSKIKNQNLLRQMFEMTPEQKIQLFIKETLTFKN